MATYAIGDVQGCYDELRKLLEHINFKSDRDRLWFCGDIVNRGPKSLKTLRFIKFLDDLFILSPEWVQEFSSKYKKEIGLPFACFVRANHVTPNIVKHLNILKQCN